MRVKDEKKRRKPTKFGDLITMDHSDMLCVGIGGFGTSSPYKM